MKYIGIFCVILMMTSQSCQSDNWSKSEKKNFIKICQEEGGTNDYCQCFLEKLMKHTPIAEELERMDYETKVELAKACE